MTKRQGRAGTIDVKAVLAEDEEFLRALVRTALQEVLETEMTEALGAEKGERAAGRQGYRSGYYGRTLITRVGKLELRVPQDRSGRFSTELFERYQRSERALVAALAEMYVQGVSTRKVRAITEELCGHSFSASSISAMNQGLDASLAQFAGRPLAEAFPYLILDARYERVRELAASMLAEGSGERYEVIIEILREGWGYTTPKVDVRGAAFVDGRVLMVREISDGKWTLPGGWADVNQSAAECVVREIAEESGFQARARKLAATFHIRVR